MLHTQSRIITLPSIFQRFSTSSVCHITFFSLPLSFFPSLMAATKKTSSSALIKHQFSQIMFHFRMGNKKRASSSFPRRKEVLKCGILGLFSTFFREGLSSASFSFIFVLSNTYYSFYHKYLKNVYLIYSAGIQTHDLEDMSLHP